MRTLAWLTLAAVLGVVVLQATGCSCRSETAAERAARIAKEEAERIAEEKKKLEEERRRQPIDLSQAPRTLPSGGEGVSLLVKPAHWIAVAQSAKANAQDFDGVLTYEVLANEGLRAPAALRLISRRPLVVARESEKVVEALLYCPPVVSGVPRLESSVRERRGGMVLAPSTIPLRPMLDHQYHLVVLAKEPDRYAFLDALYSVTAPLRDTVDTSAVNPSQLSLDAQKNYRVVAVPIDEPSGLALPDNPLAWTSIAYVLWDEVDPESLRPDQRDALVDWINWGGQLIVNGPDSLDLLRGSFLEPLLPATWGGARQIPRREIELLEASWAAGDTGRPLAADSEWTGVELEPVSGSVALRGAVNLLVERRVGRGRVLVSGMQLADRRLVAWSRGVDNLFNGAILRRPARRFVPRTTGAAVGGAGQKVAVEWAPPLEPMRIDPLLNAKQRYFVRDAHVDMDALQLRYQSMGVTSGGGPPARPPWAQGSANQPVGGPAAGGPAAGVQGPGGQGAPFGGEFGGGAFGGGAGQQPGGFVGANVGEEDWVTLAPAAVPGGVGAMNDFNLAATAARERLSDSAGVSVPGSGFVVACLAAYLFFLAPANWAFFAAIRRVELAWVAAPVIAVVGAWVVIQQARLDIGFVRSRVEVGVLELQPDTPRGLLTRFTALYTSLSTTYDMEFDGAAVAAPFPRSAEGPSNPIGEPQAVAYERMEKTRLRDIAVSSATTEYIRSEQVIDVGAYGLPGSSVPGSIRLEPRPGGGERVVNRTAWRLDDVVVVERPDGLAGPARLRGCWLGDLEPGSAASVAFLALPAPPEGDGQAPPIPFAEEREAAAQLRRDEQEPMRLDDLLRLALDASRYEPGERRVVARVSQVMPGLTIEPAASQQAGATLVVAHLGYGPPPPPQSDVNGPMDVR